MIETESTHSRYLKLIQITTDITYLLDFYPKMTEQAISANRPIDQNIGEIRSN